MSEVESSFEFRELVRELIQAVCSYKTEKAEKKMAYIFNVIIFNSGADPGKNASAKATREFMNGKSMFVLKNKMCSYIYEMFSLKLKNSDIESIVKAVGDKAPTDDGNRICSLTAKTITDWTNRIKKHVTGELHKRGMHI